jgi:1-phosphofructokinase family hexose kinase
MLIAGPNLTIDRTLSIEELRPGEVLRFDRAAVTPGGKGVNVARGARALGVPALLVAFLPGHTGRAAEAMLADEGVELRGVPIGGEIRSTAVVIEHGGRTTVMNEPGPELGAGDWEAYERALAFDGHGVLVCSGSIPPGSPRDAYARLTTLAHEAGARSVVDASGEALAAALEAAPDVVAPNLSEAEGVLGTGGGGEEVEAAEDAQPRALAAASGLVERGARAALVSAAAAGAALAEAGAEPLWIPAPTVSEVRNPIGAGDVLTSGLAAALERRDALPAAALAGVAAAAASVEWPTAGELDPARARELADVMRASRPRT